MNYLKIKYIKYIALILFLYILRFDEEGLTISPPIKKTFGLSLLHELKKNKILTIIISFNIIKVLFLRII